MKILLLILCLFFSFSVYCEDVTILDYCRQESSPEEIEFWFGNQMIFNSDGPLDNTNAEEFSYSEEQAEACWQGFNIYFDRSVESL